MTLVWQIKDEVSDLWISDTSQGWNYLVQQDDAWIWRTEKLAEKARKKILSEWKERKNNPSYYSLFKGFESHSEICGVDSDGHEIPKYYPIVVLRVVCYKLVPGVEGG